MRQFWPHQSANRARKSKARTPFNFHASPVRERDVALMHYFAKICWVPIIKLYAATWLVCMTLLSSDNNVMKFSLKRKTPTVSCVKSLHRYCSQFELFIVFAWEGIPFGMFQENLFNYDFICRLKTSRKQFIAEIYMEQCLVRNSFSIANWVHPGSKICQKNLVSHPSSSNPDIGWFPWNSFGTPLYCFVRYVWNFVHQRFMACWIWIRSWFSPNFFSDNCTLNLLRTRSVLRQNLGF